MIKDMGKVIKYTLLWVAVAGFVLFFGNKARQYYAQKVLTTIEVHIAGEGSSDIFITREDILQWIAEDSVATIKKPLSTIDVAAVERSILRREVIEKATAYTLHTGKLVIDVKQRKALLRLACEGYNCYVTEDMNVIHIPADKARYVQVVSGTYRPPFPPEHRLSVKSHIDSLIAQHEAKIKELEQQKQPYNKQKEELKQRRKEIASRGLTQYEEEPDSEFAKREKAHREEKRLLLRDLRYKENMLDKNLEELTSLQQKEQNEQKNLLKRYEDFSKLINFVKYIEQSSFWRSEIVQIEAYSMSSGELALRLIPRSGSFIIELGVPDNIKTKLENLQLFYREGLDNVGWDKFEKISVEYSGKVVGTPHKQ